MAEESVPGTETFVREREITRADTGQRVLFREIGRRTAVFTQSDDHFGNITRMYGEVHIPRADAQLRPALKADLDADLARISAIKLSTDIDTL